MRDWIGRLAELYDAYLKDMARCEQERASLRGAFGSLLGGPGAGSDSCNDRFSEGMAACLGEFAESGPAPADTAAVMAYVLEQTGQRPAGRDARLMLRAVEGLLIPLTGFLSPRDAGELLRRYVEDPKGEPFLPGQKSLRAELAKRDASGSPKGSTEGPPGFAAGAGRARFPWPWKARKGGS